jgi:hypothetical protein
VKPGDVERLAAAVIEWAPNLAEISVVAMIGALARGGANASSDLDFSGCARR